MFKHGRGFCFVCVLQEKLIRSPITEQSSLSLRVGETERQADRTGGKTNHYHEHSLSCLFQFFVVFGVESQLHCLASDIVVHDGIVQPETEDRLFPRASWEKQNCPIHALVLLIHDLTYLNASTCWILGLKF